MPNRLGALAGCLLILLAISPLEAANPAAEDHSLELLESGVARVEFGDKKGQLPYSRTLAGPLFALQPLASVLGGEFSAGPLRQKHEIRIGDASFLFGPGASTLTEGQEMKLLSQAPLVGPGGLHVPLDLLQELYGNLLGFDFSWKPAAKILAIKRRPLREMPVTLDVVHLQGVTTLVFEFPDRPRYRIERSGNHLTVELIGDRLKMASPRLFAADEFVRDVRLTPQAIQIELAPSSDAQDYVLERPFRIVFDVLRGTPGTVRTGGPVARLPSQPPARKKRSGVRTVVIDPGHGGRDTGALGGGGSEEKRLTLQIARQLKSRLEQELNLRVILTRNGDSEIDLDQRPALANQNKGDLFISLHVNSSPDPEAHGAETYFSSLEAGDADAERAAATENASAADPLYDLQLILWDLAQSRHLAQSQSLAGLMQAELNKALDLHNRGVKQAPFRVLLGAAMPAVLVELGFLSNSDEERKLGDSNYRRQLADALVRAVSRYKSMLDGSGPGDSGAATSELSR